MMGESGVLGELLNEFCDFLILALDDELDGAVGEVFHGSDDIESGGELFGGVAESDALDAAFENVLFRFHFW